MLNPVEVEIPDDIRERLESQASGGHFNTRSWTPQEDAILLKYWPLTYTTALTKEAVAKEIGCHYSTCRKRYEELTNGNV